MLGTQGNREYNDVARQASASKLLLINSECEQEMADKT
jgi:hypothetical protein